MSAWRWRYTARILGIDLSLGEAIKEYYLAMFITQLIPGGVTGDVARAWRHARRQRDTPELVGRAARAVVIERASGQVVMVLVAIGSAFIIMASHGGSPTLLVLAAAAIAVTGGVVFRWVHHQTAEPASVWQALKSESRLALFSRRAFAWQMISSFVVVSTFLANYLIAAEAIGVETSVGRLLPLVAPVLITMLVPFTVAGWGAREAGAAAVWSFAGLSLEDGIAISVTYGVVVFLSTLPGGLILVLDLWARRR